MLIGRSVLSEAGRAFFASLVATTGMAFFVLSINFMKRTPGVGLDFLVEVFPLFFPLAVQFTLPLAVLNGVVLTFGRMAYERELVALAASGVPVWHAVRPALAAAAGISLVSLLLLDALPPFAASRLRAARQDVLHQIQTAFRSGLGDLQLGRTNLSFESFRGDRATDLCVEYPAKDGAPVLARAREGTIAVTGDDTLLLGLRQPRAVFPYRTSRGEVFASADEVVVEFSLAQIMAESGIARKSPDLRAWELAYIGERPAQAGTRLTPRNTAEELARRTALAASAFFFAFVGIPLGILTARGGRVAAFFAAIAPVVLLYFPLLVAGSALARKGILPAYPALWAANAALLAMGILLYRRIARR